LILPEQVLVTPKLVKLSASFFEPHPLPVVFILLHPLPFVKYADPAPSSKNHPNNSVGAIFFSVGGVWWAYLVFFLSNLYAPSNLPNY